ncbi:MAG TPA: SDR family oxidoreductase [Candidatus Limnocylindrales bacterium]|nr:SDR family oxidoreductase [Candidatus Limnocylindrales bacterium]
MSIGIDLSGRVAIVTGGGRGLGRSIALGLARAGADVALAGRKIESCEDAARDVRSLGRRALAASCHMGRTEEIDALFERTIAELGRVDIVINNAATSPAARPLIAGTPELFDRIYAINVRGPLHLACRAAAWMADHGGGAIVNVVSVGAFRPGPTIGLYCSSKSALHALTRVMALEWAPLGVRVNALAPGPVNTDMVKATEGTDFHRLMSEATAMKRISEPEEIVGSVLYLVSDLSPYTTGSTLVVDGGMNT